MSLRSVYLPKGTVLVLEEEPTVRGGLCSLFAAAGYALAESPGGVDPRGQIDLVLAGIGAIETAKAAPDVLERTAPIILLVDSKAWTRFNFFDVANDLGAIAVLQRPFPRSALLRLIADVLAPLRREAVALTDRSLCGSSEFTPLLENPKFV